MEWKAKTCLLTNPWQIIGSGLACKIRHGTCGRWYRENHTEKKQIRLLAAPRAVLRLSLNLAPRGVSGFALDRSAVGGANGPVKNDGKTMA